MMDGEATQTVADELRAAFAAGRSVDGEQLLARALEAGLPWDLLTRAVADGVTRHYRSDQLPAEQLVTALTLS
jgi:hypothetical protein